MESTVTSPSLDLAAEAGALSPVLGRYYETSWSHGEGHRLFDTTGRAYLDFANGIACTILGHAHPRVNAAIHAQVDRLLGPTGAIGYSEPVVRLASMIAEELPGELDTVFFLNSGSEAIEAAIKLARRVTGRPAIIAFEGAFHGRTLGAASITSSALNYRVGYEPLLPAVYLTPFPRSWPDYGGDDEAATRGAMVQLERLTSTAVPPSAVGAIVIEPVQGEGGYYPAPPSFLRVLRSFCDQHGILLVADEVQSGYGRTGRMWGVEHAGVVPDVVAMAKALANGLPLSALATRRELQERWGKSAHGSTYGGNPVACAAGIAVLETIRDEGLIENAARIGDQLSAGLRAMQAEDDRIGDVRGPGLMIGVDLVDPGSGAPDGALADRVRGRAHDLGLLLLTCGPQHQVVRWIAPLDASAAEAAEALEVFGEALRTA